MLGGLVAAAAYVEACAGVIDAHALQGVPIYGGGVVIYTDFAYSAGEGAADASVLEGEDVGVFFFSRGGVVLGVRRGGIVKDTGVIRGGAGGTLAVGVNHHHTDAVFLDVLLGDA